MSQDATTPNTSTAAAASSVATASHEPPPDEGCLFEKGGIKFFSRQGRLGFPTPEAIIAHFVFEQTFTLLLGDPGVGKSGLLIDIFLHIANGLPWMGYRTAQGPTLLVPGEGLSGFKKREDAWNLVYGVDGQRTPFFCTNGPVNLFDDAAVDIFCDAVVEFGQMIGQPIKLIGFDTLSRCSIGAEENSNSDMGRVVANIGKIIARTRASVCAPHHNPKGGGTMGRGASAVPGAADTIFSVSVVSEKDALIELKVVKQKDDAPITPIRFIKRQVLLGFDRYGDAITSFVLEPAGRGAAKDASASLTQMQVRVLKVLQDSGATGLSHDEWRAASADAGIKRQTFGSAKEALIARKRVEERDGRFFAATNDNEKGGNQEQEKAERTA